MKKFLLTISLIMLMIISTGCKEKEKSMILFNTEPITIETAMHATHVFDEGQKIYYLFFTPEKLQTKFIRVQVFKASELVDRGGYDIVWNNDYRVMKQNMYYYYNNFTLYQKGKYFMQVFALDNLAEPLAYNEFWIK